MEFGLQADGRAGWVRGDDGDGGYWSSRRWCLRRGTVLRSAQLEEPAPNRRPRVQQVPEIAGAERAGAPGRRCSRRIL